MAEFRVSLSYEDLKELITKDSDIFVEIRSGIVKTFSEKYLIDSIHDQIATEDRGVLREMVRKEMDTFYTQERRYNSYVALSAHVKAEMDKYMKDNLQELIKNTHAVTFTRTMSMLDNSRSDILKAVEDKIQEKIVAVTEETINKLVLEHVNAIYKTIKDDIKVTTT